MLSKMKPYMLKARIREPYSMLVGFIQFNIYPFVITVFIKEYYQYIAI